MRWSEEFIQRVLEANNLFEIVSPYTQLKPASGGWMGRCPFPDHPEKTPSFSLSETKQVYNCFGCGKRGNIITFLRDYRGLSYREAIEFLADRAGIPLPLETQSQETSEISRRIKDKKEIFHLNRLALEYFKTQLKAHSQAGPAREYLQRRGLTPETLEKFQVGYAPPEGLVAFLKSKKASLDLAVQAQLIRVRKEGVGHYDLFRDRIQFPIINPTGDVVGFGGRIVSSGEPKYLNSPETPVFTKGKVLYGLDQTARYIRSEDSAILVEGYMDLVALFQNGIFPVVAALGTAFTSDHAKLLLRMTKSVVALFDGDSAGRAAAEKALPLLLGAGLHPRGLILPDGLDPDDFVQKKGPDRLRKMLEEAPDLFEVVSDQWFLDYRGTSSEKVALCDRYQPLFQVIPDLRLRDLYMRALARRLQVDKVWLEQALKTTERVEAPQVAAPQKPQLSTPASGQEQDSNQVYKLKNAPLTERTVFKLMLKNRACWEAGAEAQVEELFSSEDLKNVYKMAQELTRQSTEKFVKLIGLLTPFVDNVSYLSDFAASEVELTEDQLQESEQIDLQVFRDGLRKLRESVLKERVDQIQKQLKVQPSAELMEELMKVQRERISLK